MFSQNNIISAHKREFQLNHVPVSKKIHVCNHIHFVGTTKCEILIPFNGRSYDHCNWQRQDSAASVWNVYQSLKCNMACKTMTITCSETGYSVAPLLLRCALFFAVFLLLTVPFALAWSSVTNVGKHKFLNIASWQGLQLQ